MKNKDEDTKVKLAEAKIRNARARKASVWVKIANVVPVDRYKQICASYASQVLAGEMVVALPVVDQKTYTATEM